MVLQIEKISYFEWHLQLAHMVLLLFIFSCLFNCKELHAKLHQQLWKSHASDSLGVKTVHISKIIHLCILYLNEKISNCNNICSNIRYKYAYYLHYYNAKKVWAIMSVKLYILLFTCKSSRAFLKGMQSSSESFVRMCAPSHLVCLGNQCL